MAYHMLSEEQIKTQPLQHPGLIVAVIDQMDLINKIDVRLALNDKKGLK